jgi:acetoin utilization protein AcuC
MYCAMIFGVFRGRALSVNILANKTAGTQTILVSGPAIAAYGFPNGHPFGPDRHDAFMAELEQSPVFPGLLVVEPEAADRETIELFHTGDYVDFVARQSGIGHGMLDGGDTPAYPGVFEDASNVVGGTIAALDRIMAGHAERGFIPIGGLHHARRDAAAGFCVFNDCGIAIEHVRRQYGLKRVAYIDIDAHHGDGVYYGFEDDPGVIVADTHEDGRYLYPGTGHRHETGTGDAVGTKLNIPLPPGAGDAEFHAAWDEIEAFLRPFEPELYLLQCGADSVVGDPITHLEFSVQAHAHAARRLRALADETASGRLLAMGGGGYNRENLARCWTGVVEALA